MTKDKRGYTFVYTMKRRYIKVTVNKVTERIPEIWLAGRYEARRREGMDLREAYRQAIADWFEQSRLAELFETQRANSAASAGTT